MGLSCCRWIWPNAIGSFALRYLLRLSEIPDTGVERHGRLLGHCVSQHSRLHAVRAQPASTSGWTSIGTPDNHDTVFPDRNPRDLGDRGHLRHGNLGPGTTAEPVSFAGRRDRFVIGDIAGNPERQYR